MFNYPFDFRVIPENWQFIAGGIGFTLLITFASLIGSFVVGLIVGVIRLKAPVLVRIPFAFYVDFFRSTPPLVQLIWFYYVMPVLIGVSLNPFVAGFLTLTLYGASFLSEVFRAGIQSIGRGQTDAAFVLGLSSFQAFVWIVLPQAIRIMLPPIASMAVAILKNSSLLSVVSAEELTYRSWILSGITFRTLEILTVLGILYFILTYPLIILVSQVERRARVAQRL